MRKRYLSALGIIAAIVIGIYYSLFVLDSPFNFYKKIKIKNYAAEYIEKNYPAFEADGISVKYDSAFKQYVASCTDGDKTIALNYSGEFFMEYDNYYNEKYTAKAVAYQKETEKILSEALSSKEIPFDNVTVFVELNATDKKNIVFNDAEIENGRIECSVTLIRKNGEATMDKYELAEYAKTVADCVYKKTGNSASITVLNIKYDYDSAGLATVSWNSRMESMSLYQIANEIKY